MGIITETSNLVEINCGTTFFQISLNVFGIASSATGSLSVLSGTVDTLNITTDGIYQFSGRIPDQATYSVSIQSNPNNHTCILEPVPPASGTVNGASVTLNVNCLSAIGTNPPNQTALLNSANITVTFSKPVQPGSCVYTAPTPAPPTTCNVDLQASAAPLNVTGNQVTISPAATWPIGSDQCIQLAGCTEAGTGKPFQIPRPARLSVAGNVKYVSVGGVASSGSCNTIANACDSIRYAASQCTPGTICSVLVSQGTYDINAMFERIQLGSGLQLIGGFNTSFTIRDSNIYTTTIRDQISAGACGGAGVNSSCAPIFNTPGLTTPFDIVIKGFRILTNPNNGNSAGILLDTINVGSNRILITENAIFGSTSTGAYCFLCVNSGISAISIPRLHIIGNYIVGGSGNSRSAGILLMNNTNAIILNNAVSGASHSGVSNDDASVGIWISNLTFSATQLVYIANNLINSHQVIASPVVSALNSYGIMALEIDSPDLIIAHNSVYGGVGTARSIGIIQQGNPASLTEVSLVNNQIFANPFATTQSYCLNYDTTNTIGGSSEIRGNNFSGCSTAVAVTANGPFQFCAPEPAPLRRTPGCATFLTNAGQVNFGHNPSFLPPVGPFDVFKLGTSSRCNSLFGGQILPGAIGFFTQIDLLGTVRSNNSAPDPVPLGSLGFSIGAFEVNGGCAP